MSDESGTGGAKCCRKGIKWQESCNCNEISGIYLIKEFIRYNENR